MIKSVFTASGHIDAALLPRDGFRINKSTVYRTTSLIYCWQKTERRGTMYVLMDLEW